MHRTHKPAQSNSRSNNRSSKPSRTASRMLARSCGIDSLEQRILFATLPANFTENLMGGSIANGTNMAFAPDGRLFVTQQTGQVRVIDHGALQATPFTTVPTYPSLTGERGLLGIAFDPDYFNNHYVYVYYTALTPAAHNRVSRFTADPANQNVAVMGSETVLLDLNNLSGATNHNGGSIHFGADGKLYIAVGENANRANAQSFGNLLGKVLRMNKDGSVPTDNPYFNDASVSGQNKLIWSLGLRNPYTFVVQPGTGRIFINDVGESTWEEIDDGIAHSNYGWGAGSPTIEGFIAGQTPPPDYRDPLFVYDHSAGQQAIIGGAFYNPVYPSYPATYNDRYFFGDLNAGWIHTINTSGAPVSNNFATGISQLSSITLGPDGSVYYLQRGGTAGAYRMRYLDTTAPTVAASAVFDEAKPTFGTSQRLRLSFNEYVGDSLTPSDLTIVNQTTGQTIPAAAMSIQYDAATNIAEISFPGFADANGALPDGNYVATMAAASVTDVAGNPLASSLNFSFFALSGDANHDRHVDAADQAILTANLNQSPRTFSQGDFNYSGTVDAADQTILTNQLHLWLPPQGSLALPATAGNDQYSLRRESAALLDVTANADTPPTYRIYEGALVSGFLQFQGGAGDDTLILDYSNGLLVNAPVTINFDGGANNDTLTIIGSPSADTVNFSASGYQVNGTNLFVTNHEFVNFDGLGGFDTVSTSSGPTVTFFNPQHFASLSVNSSSSAAAEAGGNALIVTRALSISPAAKLDLNDNDMIFDYSSGPQIGAIQLLINNARAGGAWTGNGITSTTARNNLPDKNTTLGAMEATDYKSISALNTTFDGEPIDNTAVLIKYTYYGDANFNGKVDGADYGRIDATFNKEHTAGDIGGWLNGDFNGDGKVDGADYGLIDGAFNSQGAPLRPSVVPTKQGPTLPGKPGNGLR